MKKVISIFLLLLIIFPSVSFAQVNAGYFGTKSETSLIMWANSSTHGNDWLSLTVYSCSNNWGVKWYDSSSSVITSNTYNDSGLKAVSVPSSGKGFKLFSNDGNEIYAYAGTTNNPNSSDVGFNRGDCGPTPDPEPEPEKPSCAEILGPILENIYYEIKNNNNATEQIKEQLSVINITINNINNSITSINNTLTIIKGELQTDQQPPTFEKPNNSDLDDYKPNLNLPVYEDDTVYFKDNGEAETAPPMPAIPEPKPWLDEEGLEMGKDSPYAPEDELSKDSELDRDSELKKDSELQKDEFTKSDEMQKDEFTKSDEMQKDEFSKSDELQRDEFSKDDELNKDVELDRDNFNQNHQYEKDSELNQGSPMQQTEKDYRLRWKSVNGVFQP